MAISHLKTVTIADGTDSAVVRPSDWNSAHQLVQAFGGNTAGVSSWSGQDLVWAGGSNVTLSVSGNTVSIVGAAGGTGGAGDGGNVIAAGGSTAASTGTVVFSNGGGVSFGLAGGTVTATVRTDYQSAGAYLTTAQPPGAYLTTGAASDHSHGAVGFTGANISGSFTSASNGLSVSLSGVSTTTPTLNQVRAPTADAVFTMGSNQVQFQFSNVGTFSTNANRQALFEIDCQGNLTDGADVLHVHQSDNNPTIDLIHVEGWGTNVTGLRLQMSASIAAEINRPLKFTALGTSSTAIGSVPFILGTQMSNSVANLNANYLEGKRSSEFQSTGAYLTTAAQSGHSHALATTTTAGASIVIGTSNSAGYTIGVPAYLTTAGATNAITTAAQSNHSHAFATTTTGGASVVVGTSNSAGVTIGVPAFLTTAQAPGAYLTTAAQSDHSHGNPTLALTNITGTTASASNGFTLSLSAGGGGVTNQTGPNIAAGASTITSGTVVFSNANGVSFGLNGQTMTASVNAGGGGNATMSRYWHPVGGLSSITSHNFTSLNSTLVLGHVLLKEDVSFTKLGAVFQISAGTATNSSGSIAMSLDLGLFGTTTSAGQWSLLSSASSSFSASWTSNSTSGVAGGPREFYVNVNGSLPPGEYVMAQIVRVGGTALGSASCTLTHYGVPMMSAVPSAEGFMVATAATANPFFPLQGVYSAATAAIPNSIHASQVTQTGTALLRGNFWKEFRA